MKEEGRRKKEEGRRKKEEGRRKKAEGRWKNETKIKKHHGTFTPGSIFKRKTLTCPVEAHLETASHPIRARFENEQTETKSSKIWHETGSNRRKTIIDSPPFDLRPIVSLNPDCSSPAAGVGAVTERPGTEGLKRDSPPASSTHMKLFSMTLLASEFMHGGREASRAHRHGRLHLRRHRVADPHMCPHDLVGLCW